MSASRVALIAATAATLLLVGCGKYGKPVRQPPQRPEPKQMVRQLVLEQEREQSRSAEDHAPAGTRAAAAYARTGAGAT